MTHRVFFHATPPRSRAIPTGKKMIAAVREEPALPVYWGRNQTGMSAAREAIAPDVEAPSLAPSGRRRWKMRCATQNASPRKTSICTSNW